MLIWFWLQNQYFTSHENALCISNNPNRGPWELHVALAGTTSILHCSVPLKLHKWGHHGYIRINALKCWGALCILQHQKQKSSQPPLRWSRSERCWKLVNEIMKA